MNQILYKGQVYGGVGEDVTGKTYEKTLNSITSFTGGTNSEIFNNYKGNNINIAEGDNSTVIGLNNIEAKIKKDNNIWIKDVNDSVLKNNFIGGEENKIGSNTKNSFIFGYKNTLVGITSGQPANGNIIGGKENRVRQAEYSLFIGQNNENSTSCVDSIIFGTDNTIDTIDHSLLGGDGNQLTFGSQSVIMGLTNEISSSIASFITGTHLEVTSSTRSLIIGSNCTIGGTTGSLIIGDNHTNNVDINYSMMIGKNLIYNSEDAIILGSFNIERVTTDKTPLFILGNGTRNEQRSDCFEIKKDGSQSITLKEPSQTITGTLGIGKFEITQNKIKITSLYNSTNNQKKTIEFTFEDLENLKTLSQVQNINNTQFPQT